MSQKKKQAENDLLLKEKQIQQANLDRQRQIILIFSIGAALLVLMILYLIKSRRTRSLLIDELNAKNQQAEKDKQTIEDQAIKLRQTDAAKTRFFANISHDLRTPLTLIMGSFEKISLDKESYLTTSSTKQLLTGQKNCERLLHLVDEINDLNLLEEGKLKLNKTTH